MAAGLNIDSSAVSVSGISSGAFMAHQLHVVHSDPIMGVGIIAGGPYYCAKGNILDAVTRCSDFVALQCAGLLKRFGLDSSACEKASRGPKDASQVKAMALESFEEAKKQNSLDNIAGDRVYIFSGVHDSIVLPGVMDAVFDLYNDPNKLGVNEGNVLYNDNFPARHTMVRDGFDRPQEKTVVGDCPVPPDPPIAPEDNSFIDDCQKVADQYREEQGCVCPPQTGAPCPPVGKHELCDETDDFDLAGVILGHIYGEEALRNGRISVLEDELQPFDQRQVFKKFAPDDWRTESQLASMAKNGYVFIPDSCKEGDVCKLHVALHGCLQGGETDDRPGHPDGNLFAKYAGYNPWAKANGIVVLYPQVKRTRLANPMNPQGCWDWWGQNYTHENYHTKRGPQIKALAQMINVLVGGEEDLLEVPAD
jgi:poly(3-hydroxybutyrate) depolymerase